MHSFLQDLFSVESEVCSAIASIFFKIWWLQIEFTGTDVLQMQQNAHMNLYVTHWISIFSRRHNVSDVRENVDNLTQYIVWEKRLTSWCGKAMEKVDDHDCKSFEFV
jgi:hypothetical protein